jgi:kynurenine formamidase
MFDERRPNRTTFRGPNRIPSSMTAPLPEQEIVSAEEFRALFRAVSSWGRWGEQDERGALNELTPERVAAAAGLVREGVSVSLSLPLNTEAAADNPSPAVHLMTMHGETVTGSGSLQVAKDFVGADYHNEGHSHIDAFCHIAYQGSLYNGKPAEAVTARGATADSIEVLKDGLVGRGVLVDVPRLRSVSWLEPGENVFRDDLEAAERDQGISLGAGDVLLVRTGLVRRLAELGPWETAVAKAGLHPTAMPFLAERGIAALGSDGNSDTAPSTTEGIAFPIHVLALNAMGVHLFDYLQLEDLAAACDRAGRWEFLFVAAPLRVPGGTGSPVNPIAVL